MWSKSNADKLKMELSGKREKQLQSFKCEKVVEDNDNIRMDSGFLSGANLSCDNIMISKDIIEDDIKHEEDKQQKETTEIKPYPKNEWPFYFQHNDDGDTYVPKYFIFIYLPNLYLKPF